MRQLTPNEIERTAFKRLPQKKRESTHGYKHSRRDKNEICPYCKNEDTEVVRDTVYLEPFRRWYADRVHKFTVVHCWCCTAVWSFYAIDEDEEESNEQ